MFFPTVGTVLVGRDDGQGVGELVLDLHAEIPDLGPGDRSFQSLAAHPAEEREHAGGSGLALGDERDQGVPEVDDVADGFVLGAGSGDGEVFQADHAVLVEVHGVDAHRRGRVAERFVLELRLGDAAQDVGELRRLEGLAGVFPLGEGDSGEEFVGVEAAAGLGDGFINRADERMVHGSLGADVREKDLPVTFLVLAEFIEQDLAGNGDLFGQPGPGEGSFSEKFREAVFAQMAFFGG